MPQLVLLAVLGLTGGFFAGLLGLGGAILMVPLLLFTPPLFGFPALDMKVVSAISLAQVTFASLAAVLVHARNNYVSRSLVTLMGVIGAIFSFAGGLLSSRVPAQTLLLIFALIATAGAVLMFIPRKEIDSERSADQITFNRTAAALIAAGVGLLAGLVGAAGGFIYVPLLMYVLGIPTRITLGSTLAIVLISSVSGLIGKLITGQVPLSMSAALVIGAIPGARWGGAVSKRFSVHTLKWLMTAVVLVSTARLWGQVAPGLGLTITPSALYATAIAVAVIGTGLIVARQRYGASASKPLFRFEAAGGENMEQANRPGNISATELQRLIEAGRQPKLIDVREPEEVARGVIPGAIHIPLGQFQQHLNEIAPGEEAVIYCRSGNRSAHACEIASRSGRRVRNLEGGILGWKGDVQRH